MLVKFWMFGMLMSTAMWLTSTALAASPKGRAATVTPPAPVALKGDPLLGREKADAERCVECHGVDGLGVDHGVGTEGKFPRLAGQHPAYILKQIQDFRSGVRQHEHMQMMARSVADEDVIDIAAYFSSLPVMKGVSAQVHTVGQKLFEHGDPSRGVVACVACHGAQGKGVVGLPLSPVIGGQSWRYLDQQLRDWRSGTRRNSSDGVMNAVMKPLTDAELESLALYLSGL